MHQRRFDMASKVVAIVGGLISAVALIISLKSNTEQRARELRWNQAKLAAELEDDMFVNDPQAFNALRMTDWGAYEFTIEGKNVLVTREEIHEALRVENNKELTQKGVFVRECFDRLFYHLGKIERAVRSELVLFKDVYSPMDYYVPFLRSVHGEVLIPYMKQLHHDDALEFMKRFDDIEIKAGTPPVISRGAVEGSGKVKKRPTRSRRSSRRRASPQPPRVREPARADALLADKVREMIAAQLGVEASEITLSASLVDLGADSLDTVELMMSFEEAFGIEIPDEDAEKLDTVGSAINYLERRISGN